MPITVLETISKSRITASDQAIGLDEGKQAAFYSLMESFLLLNPSPSDEHIHMLAEATGMDPETFEQLIYQSFGSLLHPPGDEDVGKTSDSEVLSDPISNEGGDELLTDVHEHEGLMARLTASNVDDNTADPVNKNLFDLNDIEPITASDPDGRAAEDDGVEDPELLGGEDPLKEASDADGAVDEELVEELLEPTEE
jgi:hypothetical protein